MDEAKNSPFKFAIVLDIPLHRFGRGYLGRHGFLKYLHSVLL
jgi:hypothetical protein